VEANLVKKATDWKFGGLFHRLRGITRLVDEALEGKLFIPASAPLGASRDNGVRHFVTDCAQVAGTMSAA
jgi:hypothetical protein